MLQVDFYSIIAFLIHLHEAFFSRIIPVASIPLFRFSILNLTFEQSNLLGRILLRENSQNFFFKASKVST